MRIYTVFIIFLQAALRVSDDTLIHDQELTQTVITTSGTGRTIFANVADVTMIHDARTHEHENCI